MSSPKKPSEVDKMEVLASEIADMTKVSEKQILALMMRELFDYSNQELMASIGAGSAASASSYVTKCKYKFQEIDEGIENLEEEIEKWERTERLSGIISVCDSFDELSSKVEEELSEGGEVEYFVSYIDENGKEDVLVTNDIPQKLDVDVVDYRRIDSVDELFE